MFSIIIIKLSSWSMLRLRQAALLVNGCNTPVWVQLLCCLNVYQLGTVDIGNFI